MRQETLVDAHMLYDQQGPPWHWIRVQRGRTSDKLRIPFCYELEAGLVSLDGSFCA